MDLRTFGAPVGYAPANGSDVDIGDGIVIAATVSRAQKGMHPFVGVQLAAGKASAKSMTPTTIALATSRWMDQRLSASRSGSAPFSLWRWTSATGVVVLDEATWAKGHFTHYYGSSRMLSSDGSVIAGTRAKEDGSQAEAFRWTAEWAATAAGDNRPPFELCGRHDAGWTLDCWSGLFVAYLFGS